MVLAYIFYGNISSRLCYLSIETGCLLSLQRVTIFNHSIVKNSESKKRFGEISSYKVIIQKNILQKSYRN